MQKTVKRCKKKQVCVLFCFFVVFKTVLFLPRRQRAGPGPTGNGPGRAGPDLPGTAMGRAGPELNGPGRAEKKRARAGL